MTEVKDALAWAVKELESNNPDCRIDTEVLLAHVLMKSRTYLYTYPEASLSQAQENTFRQLIRQRAKGCPIAYLTGFREFWSLPLKVSEDTLIPRPETELLVEITLRLLADKKNACILDLGTGSGAVALAIAKEKPNWSVLACDYSESALKIAEENAARLGISNVRFYHSNWFAAISDPLSFDAIVSNPPYIASDDPHLQQGDIRFEPSSALVSGDKGLDALKLIIQQSVARLEPKGLLLVEHGYDQQFAVQSMFTDHGYDQIQCWQDWQGNDRVSGGRRIIS